MQDDRPFEYKQCIVLRTDLGMSIGKLVSQACHASLEASEQARKKKRRIWKAWMEEGSKKVILKVDSLEELEELAKKAQELGIPNTLIVDRGLTEIPPGTTTALGVGPDRSEKIDLVTGKLKLLK
ncbi:peptidyl-tRNA hydrolase Pth2 [Candidatus Bathyarchaeota archaeon]|nr:peptidyl-tRNA hydrolase Pth2 [Candidatus Bathyarchaeota archaeon]